MVSEAGGDSIMSACAHKGLRTAVDRGHGADLVPQLVDFYSELLKG